MKRRDMLIAAVVATSAATLPLLLGAQSAAVPHDALYSLTERADADIMYPDTMNSQTPGSALIGGWDRAGEDAREGIRALYGSNSTGVDLGVSPFRFTGNVASSGEPFAERVPDPAECGGGELRFASVSEQVSRCFCIHDLGTTTESGVVTKLYFSSDDDVIETTDDVAATWSSIQVRPNAPYCATRTFSVPNLASGSYRVGVIIDPGNAITEYDETNNKASDWMDFTIL